MKYKLDSIIAYMRDKGHVIFDDGRPYNINLVAVRASDTVSNKFDDTLILFYRDAGNWVVHEFPVTVDPGTVYRVSPISKLGTAIIMPGQYRGMWKVGLHKGKYKALVQNKPCTVARDNNRDYFLDHSIPSHSSIHTIVSGTSTINNYLDSNDKVVFTTETGMFGINCHKAGKGTTINVNSYSAGCVVFANEFDFDHIFLPLCDAAANSCGNSFTFSLMLSFKLNYD